jgi:hypothetical protein
MGFVLLSGLSGAYQVKLNAMNDSRPASEFASQLRLRPVGLVRGRLRALAAWSVMGVLVSDLRSQADPLVVGGGQTVQLGDPQQPSSVGYDSLTIEPEGTLEFLGDLTLTVSGDITINGRIRSHPKDGWGPSPKGLSGADGPDNAQIAGDAGGGGILGERGTNWRRGAARRASKSGKGCDRRRHRTVA